MSTWIHTLAGGVVALALIKNYLPTAIHFYIPGEREIERLSRLDPNVYVSRYYYSILLFSIFVDIQ